MNVLALVDTETAGFDPNKHALLELAAALVDVRTGKLVRAFSLLVNDTTREHGAEEVHGITQELSATYGIALEPALHQLKAHVAQADVALAYNAGFDSMWLTDMVLYDAAEMPWPKRCDGRSQVAVALAHGIGVTAAHRALDDVLTLQRVLERCVELGASLEAMVRHVMRPRAEYVALASYEERETVKAAGFRWYPERKEWRRVMFKGDVERLTFKVREAG